MSHAKLNKFMAEKVMGAKLQSSRKINPPKLEEWYEFPDGTIKDFYELEYTTDINQAMMCANEMNPQVWQMTLWRNDEGYFKCVFEEWYKRNDGFRGD